MARRRTRGRSSSRTRQSSRLKQQQPQQPQQQTSISDLLHADLKPGTIRGVRASVVESRLGQYLVAPGGGEETFALSQPTEAIGEFISHSWTRAEDTAEDRPYGLLKWLSLCVHRNSAAAALAGIASGAAVAALEASTGTFLLPVARQHWFDGHVRCVSFAAYAIAEVAFLGVLLFHGALASAAARAFELLPLPRGLRRWVVQAVRRVGVSGDPLMFLDKICIHQSDPRRNKEGLKAINEFIRRSSKLLVCQGGGEAPGRGYFERLWCVFELAAFVKQREKQPPNSTEALTNGTPRLRRPPPPPPLADSIVVLPLLRPVALLALQLALFTVHILEYIHILSHNGPDPNAFSLSSFFVGGGSATAPPLLSSQGEESAFFTCEAASLAEEEANQLASSGLAFTVRLWLLLSVCLVAPFWIDIIEVNKEEELIGQLRTFRFDDVECTNVDDRERIRVAIEELYRGDGGGDDGDDGGDDGGGGVGGNGGRRHRHRSKSRGRHNSRGRSRSRSRSRSREMKSSTRTGVEAFDEDVRSGEVCAAIRHCLGRQIGVLGRRQAALAFLPNLFRAFSYLPANLAAQPNLFLFHGVVLFALSVFVRELCLHFYAKFMKTSRRLFHVKFLPLLFSWPPAAAGREGGRVVEPPVFLAERAGAVFFLSAVYAFLLLLLAYPSLYCLRLF